MSVDATGNLFITDNFNLRIRKLNPAGIISTVAGNGLVAYTGNGGPAVDASLDFPRQAVVDIAGSLYIADSGNNVTIASITPSWFRSIQRLRYGGWFAEMHSETLWFSIAIQVVV